MAQKTPVTTAVGRLIGGSVTQLQPVKDNKGQPKLDKAGQPRKEIYFTLAIPKEAGHTHWAQTAWGALIYQVGATVYPAVCQSHAFAWKIIDGDSPLADKKGKPWNSKANYPGNWVLRLSSGFPPQVYMRNAAGALAQVVDPNFLKLGYYVQVALGVSGNDSADTPGLYLNPSMVCFSAYGEEIFIGPDADSAGFGASPLPAGASATPLAGMAMPAAPGAAPTPPMPPGAAPAPFVPPQPVAAPMPPAPAPAPIPAGLVPVPGAAYTIEQCRAGGWTDDQIVAQGVATRPAVLPPPLPQAISAPAPVMPAAGIAPVGLVPNPTFVNPPPAPGAIMPPPPAAAPVGPQLTAAGAALGTYAGFLAQGWNDAQMRQAGYIV